jgi:Tol biopolymer transport system component
MRANIAMPCACLRYLDEPFSSRTASLKYENTQPALPDHDFNARIDVVRSREAIMRRVDRGVAAAAAALGFLAFSGCTDSTSSAPETTALLVAVSTTGVFGNFDLDGYNVIVDGNLTKRVSNNSSVLFNNIEVGTHSVMLEDLDKNCTVQGPNPRSVTVEKAGNNPTTLSIGVGCTLRTGTLRVSVQTSGADLDADGYRVLAAGAFRGNLDSNGSISFQLPAGSTQVRLDGIAGNCIVNDPTSVVVNVPFDNSVDVSFVVQCVQGAFVDFTTSTTGVELDASGYQVGLTSRDKTRGVILDVGTNGVFSVGPFVPGTYTLTLFDVSANCDVALPSPSEVTLTAGRNSLQADVKCNAPVDVVFAGSNGLTSNLYLTNTIHSQVTRLTQNARSEFDPVWSPDGKQIAFASDGDVFRDIYLIDAGGSNLRKITTEGGQSPSWSPDGRRILFTSTRGGSADLYSMNADGTGLVRLTFESSSEANGTWSPDGSRIAFQTNKSGSWDIYVMNADGTGQTRLTQSGLDETEPAWSPDGSRIAYVGTVGASGQVDIFLLTPSGTPLSSLGLVDLSPRSPSWSPDGRNIVVATTVDCYYYYYNYCHPAILVVDPRGVQHTPIQLSSLSAIARPSLRP